MGEDIARRVEPDFAWHVQEAAEEATLRRREVHDNVMAMGDAPRGPSSIHGGEVPRGSRIEDPRAAKGDYQGRLDSEQYGPVQGGKRGQRPAEAVACDHKAGLRPRPQGPEECIRRRAGDLPPGPQEPRMHAAVVASRVVRHLLQLQVEHVINLSNAPSEARDNQAWRGSYETAGRGAADEHLFHAEGGHTEGRGGLPARRARPAIHVAVCSIGQEDCPHSFGHIEGRRARHRAPAKIAGHHVPSAPRPLVASMDAIGPPQGDVRPEEMCAKLYLACDERVEAAEALVELLDHVSEGENAEDRLLELGEVLVGHHAVLPLLQMAQRVMRHQDLSPIVDPARPDALREADAGVAVLSRLAMAAALRLRANCWSLVPDETTGRTAFLHDETGVCQLMPPELSLSWAGSLLLELPLLTEPLSIHTDGTVRWPVSVVHLSKDVTVLDVAMDTDGDAGGATVRQLVLEPWQDVDGHRVAEFDLADSPGEHVDRWDITTAAAHLAAARAPQCCLLGLGGGLLPAFCARHGLSAVATFEPSAPVVEAVRQFFHLPPGCSVTSPTEPAAVDAAVELERWLATCPPTAAVVVDLMALVDRWRSAASTARFLKAAMQRCGHVLIATGDADADEVLEELRAGAQGLDDMQLWRYLDDNGLERGQVLRACPRNATGDLKASWSRHPPPSTLPFTPDVCTVDSSSCTVRLSWTEAESTRATAMLTELDRGPGAHDPWHIFGDDGGNGGPAEAPPASAKRRRDDEPLHGLATGLPYCLDGNLVAPLVRAPPTGAALARARSRLLDDGYVVLDEPLTTSPAPLQELNKLMARLLRSPPLVPACVYLFDGTWPLVMGLWDMAEALLRCPCNLEPSVAAFKLSFEAARAGRRYPGTNFGRPHRDYSHAQAIGTDGEPRIVSMWVPLNAVTAHNGPMYVVPKQQDPDFNKAADDSDLRAPSVPVQGVRCLAPHPAGTVMAWTANLIHWGSACEKDGALDPRASIALVFRSAAAASDGAATPLSRADVSGLDQQGRVALVRRAVAYFSSWYEVPRDLDARLG